MPVTNIIGLSRLAKPLTSAEGQRILERDRYRCQYCGLDGLASFENSLIMTVDFVHPRARKGKKASENLVSACRPCNVIKGHRVFKTFEEAKTYVMWRRGELQKEWEGKTAKLREQPATATAAT
jgi:5-methylcytosine-specific restriction endonuclease McrA